MIQSDSHAVLCLFPRRKLLSQGRRVIKYQLSCSQLFFVNGTKSGMAYLHHWQDAITLLSFRPFLVSVFDCFVSVLVLTNPQNKVEKISHTHSPLPISIFPSWQGIGPDIWFRCSMIWDINCWAAQALKFWTNCRASGLLLI